jgi:ribonuclease D
VVNEVLARPKEELPKLPKQHHQQEGSSAATELLKVLLRLTAEKEGVAAKVLAGSDDLDRIAADGAEADVPALHGWRREVFGNRALELVEGKLALRFQKRRIAVMELSSPDD